MVRGPFAGTLLDGPSASSILVRIVDGDPLGIEPICRALLRERALLVDSERAITTTFAFIARRAVSASGTIELGPWLARVAAEALDDMLRDDRESAEQSERIEPDDLRYAAFAEVLGLTTGAAARACAAFNRLPDRVRKDFWEATREGRSMDEVGRTSDRTAQEVRVNVERALRTLARQCDPGAQSGADA